MSRRFLYYGAAMGGAQIFSFLALFAYTSQLKPEVYAYVAIFETVLLLLQSVISGAVDRAAQRFYFDKEPLKVISTCTTLGGSIALALFPIIAVGTILFSYLDIVDITVIYVAALGYVLHTMILVKYQFSEKPKLYFYTSMVKSLTFFLSSLIFLLVFKMNEEAFLYASFVTGTILIIFTILNTRPSLLQLKDYPFIKEILMYSLPFVPTLLASWVITWSTRFFMVGHVTSEEIGVFSAAQKVAMVFFIFTQAITLVVTPILFRILKEKMYKKAKQQMVFNVNVLMVTALSIAFFLPAILLSFLGKEYEKVEEYILLLMYINFISSIMGVSTSILFNYFKKTALQMKIFLSVAVLALGLNVILIPLYGMLGVTFSLFTPITMLLIIHFYFVNRYMAFPSFVLPVIRACFVFTIIVSVSYLALLLRVDELVVLISKGITLVTLIFFLFKDKIKLFFKNSLNIFV